MAITGGIKFFTENMALLDTGGSVVSGNSNSQIVANNCIDKFSYTNWTSVASSDAVQETLTIYFPSATFNRILLLDHNWKNYTVQYWNGSTYVDFSSVVGLDGSLSVISETAFSDIASYYEFASVTASRIQIKINTTQVANAQKYIASVLVANELGTMQGYPVVDSNTFARNNRNLQMLSGRTRIVKQPQIFSLTMSFKNYPVLSYGADIDLLFTLADSEDPFFIWPCGGRRNKNGHTYFNYAVRGWRLKDCYRVQIPTDIAATWTNNIYTSGHNIPKIVFTEHV